MKYSETEIASLYEQSREEAKEKLSTLAVAEGRLTTANLGGWVFEQTIRFCLSKELSDEGLSLEMGEQVSLSGRAKIDLLVGRAAIELKAGGSFGACDLKYEGYRRTAESRNWTYLYLGLQESHAPFRRATEVCFSVSRTFFLDTPGHWKRFVNAVISSNTSHENGGLPRNLTS